VGGVALATGITGHCPAYDLIGIDTTRDDDTSVEVTMPAESGGDRDPTATTDRH
jgi:hypothetical protein